MSMGNDIDKNMVKGTMKVNSVQKLILSALFLAIGIILPFITMQIPAVGNMLCPMHIPILLCGFICGGPYGLAVGFLTPLVRGMLTGMPVLFPNGIAMAFELAVYGGLTGVLYGRVRRRMTELPAIYLTLVTSMLAGRIVWGLVSYVLFKVAGNVFTWQIFAAQAFLNAIPGIVIQLILIPVIVRSLQKAGAA